MPDLTDQFLPKLKEHRLPGLDLGGGFVYPDYAGRSILNIPASVSRLLGAGEFGSGPLAPEYLAPFADKDFRRVILVVVDALSLHRLARWSADGTAPVWGSLAQAGLLAPLASVVPSTTSAALTSLWTGRSAAEHGITGYEMWLKEYGVVANTIRHAPISYKGDAGSLERAGFDPRGFMPLPTLGTHLSARGVKPFVFQHYSILNSGLSEMYFQDVHRRAFGTAADLWVNLRRAVEDDSIKRMYAYVYWSEIDTFSHRYGPDDERTTAEFALLSEAFERLFLARLKPEARAGTLLILTADHGQIATNPDPHYDLANHPSLARRLHILPTGENRWMYFYVRPGQTEAVREYLARTWPNQFRVLDPAHAVEAGLFGPGAPHPRLLDRLGDFIVLARDHAYLWWAGKENRLTGRHGGLHPDEMLVPFLAVPL